MRASIATARIDHSSEMRTEEAEAQCGVCPPRASPRIPWKENADEIVPSQGSLIAIFAAAAVLSHSSPLFADDDDGDRDESKIRKGFKIAPVPLNLKSKNRALVGLGSYIVNAQGGCNDCHTNPPYASGGDPFKGEPKKVNAAGYLGGGTAFGPFVSRNLTPDKSELPLGGDSFAEFKLIMRTGIDLDNAHPQIGPLLQVMPWPVYQDMTDRDPRDLRISKRHPCVEGGPGAPPNRCK